MRVKVYAPHSGFAGSEEEASFIWTRVIAIKEFSNLPGCTFQGPLAYFGTIFVCVH